ncbi:MAG TPA: peptidoglycan DD-metalloendopeptidase family protein [Candidatus Eisenbacteria bacterium]|nr:peptidoglycan DD-metalloendopeptidase family protein [Candidatus Eisenbacteria bacterium]
MSRIISTSNSSFRIMVGNAAKAVGSILMLVAVALLSAPFVNSLQHEAESLPAAAKPSNAQTSIGAMFRSGDNLLSALRRVALEAPLPHGLIEKIHPLLNLRKLRPENNIHVMLDEQDKTVSAMEFVVDNKLIRVKAPNEASLTERQEVPFVKESRVVQGRIKSNLYESGIDAGLSPLQILDLAKIFESDVDFFSDLHPGDDFKVIMEDRRYLDGRRAAGRILAAEFEVEDQIIDAFYYEKNGVGNYYNRKGESLRRSFLRAPLSYARISSPFSANRLNPFSRSVRPHLAIDYAAPFGTPVVAIGRGQVEFAGWRSGYGNVVDIRHSENYLSRYAHFSRLAADLRVGQWVETGDVIGYVGQTGHATGPHLHFEFLHGERKINFLDLHTAKAQELKGADLQSFFASRDRQLALLHPRNSEIKTAQKSF